MNFKKINYTKIDEGLICEKRHKIINTTARPTAKFILYMAAKKINAIKIKLPKIVSNNVTKRPGIANITTHKIINNVINPTTKLRFFLENTLPNDKAILYILTIK
jgi:hypothetical protein